MQSPQMQQLRQRVIASYHLGPMDRQETQGYVEHRLTHVGWQGNPKFEPGAFDAIYSFSAGIPRRINTLCNRVLLAAYLAEKKSIAAIDIDSVASEIKQELGPTTVGPAPVASAADGPRPSASANASALEMMTGLDERLGRLERTTTAIIDLLHQLLQRERQQKQGAKANG
jgi:type II secretory pathway predicted ATPase ExeA